jgi:hypothetical protein
MKLWPLLLFLLFACGEKQTGQQSKGAQKAPMEKETYVDKLTLLMQKNHNVTLEGARILSTKAVEYQGLKGEEKKKFEKEFEELKVEVIEKYGIKK